MAMKTSFKQQCPSCETMVPIRDTALVGKKIDCPKCKYRFVVEAPEDDEGAEEVVEQKPASKAAAAKNAIKAAGANGATNGNGKPALKTGVKTEAPKPGDKPAKPGDKPAKKKKKPATAEKNKKMLWIGVAVVAVALLGVGGWLLFGRGEKEEKKPAAKKKTGGDDKKDDKKDDDKKDPPVESGVEIANLLPNDSDEVRVLNLEGTADVPAFFPNSALHSVVFGTPGAFQAKPFEEKFGFAPDKIKQAVIGANSKQAWSFAVIRTSERLVKDQLVTRLNLKPGAQKFDHEYFVTTTPLDDLSVLLFKDLRNKPTAVHIYDDTTLVLGDVKPVETFLAGKRQPVVLTKVEASAGGGGQLGQMGGPPMGFMGQQGGPPMGGAAGGPPMGLMGMAGGPPMGGAAGGPPMGFMGMAGGPPMGGAAGGPPQGGAAGGPPMGMGMAGGPPMGFQGAVGGPPGGFMGQQGGQTVVSGSFVTIKPSFKRVLDNLDATKRMFAVVGDGDSAVKTMPFGDNFGGGVGEGVKIEDLLKGEMPAAIGFAVKNFSEVRLTVGVALEMKLPSDAVVIEQTVRLLAKPVVDGLAKAPTKLKVTLLGGSGFFGQAGANGAAGGQAGQVGFFGQAGGPPPGFMGAAGGPPQGGAAGGPPVGVMGAAGGPPQGGAAGGPPMEFMGAAGGPPPGFMGAAGGPPVGFMGAAGGPPGGFMGMMGGQVDANASTLKLKATNRIFSAELDLKLGDHQEIFRAVRGAMSQGIVAVRNQAMLTSHRAHRHELAAALMAYTKEKGAFPRGTVERARERNQLLEWKPADKLGWTADLLRYLGPSYAAIPIDPSKSWNEGTNLSAALTAIPHLVAPDEPAGKYPPDSWRKTASGSQFPVAVSHFVGISGVGLDAAKFTPGDAATDKLLGVFGYDRVTKVSDIKDGLDKTIAVIQVPPAFKGCWLSGGGATVRGVDEIDPLEQFVCTEYKGRPGTFAIMCDGKVRFIDKDMKPEVFKALCTIAGGEPLDNIDTIAPEVKQEIVVKPVDLPKPPGGDGSIGPGAFKDEKLGFSFVFRGEPTKKSVPTKTELGEGTVTVFADAVPGSHFLGIIVSDFPVVPRADQKKEVYEGLVDGTLGKKGSPYRTITFAGVDGVAFEQDMPNVGQLITRAVLSGNKVYSVAVGPTSTLKATEIEAAFNSFKLLMKSPADPPKPDDKPKPPDDGSNVQKGDWVDFVDPDGRFRVWMPVSPLKGKVTTTKNGRVYSSFNGNCEQGAFLVFIEMFPQQIDPAKLRELYGLYTEMVLEKHPGATVKERAIKVDGIAGLECEITDKQGEFTDVATSVSSSISLCCRAMERTKEPSQRAMRGNASIPSGSQ